MTCPGCAARGWLDTELCAAFGHVAAEVIQRQARHQPRHDLRLRCRRCREWIALTLTRPEAA